MDKITDTCCTGVLKARTGSHGEPTGYSEFGASLVEYALLVALISVVALGGMSLVGQNTSDTITIAACGMEDDPIDCCADRGIDNPGAVCGPLEKEKSEL